ncbi:MAG TPA: DUF1573 domain-containing protein [Deltaproteobacteria bacterium]|nr:DUF1573 domain-containing protein [Deltaproteobacteria bacterium]
MKAGKPLLAGGCIIVAALLVLCTGWGSLVGEAPQKPEPKTHFYFGLPEKPVYSRSVVESPKSRYVFAPVLQFDLVQHDFVIRNTSGRTLVLEKAHACCGALVEHYTREIPPKGEGVIRIVLLTDRRGGQYIAGTVRAETNDPEHPEWTIEISCYVKKFADISDYSITLIGSSQQVLEGISTVIPTKDYPFRITALKAKKGRDVTYGYTEVQKDGKRAYTITVRNIRKEPGVFRDTIYVQTDNPARPEFKIRVQGKITG